jgi:hypothetical protein
VKVGVWCAVNARIVGPVFFNKTVAKDMHRSFWGILSRVNRRIKTHWLVSGTLSYCPH